MAPGPESKPATVLWEYKTAVHDCLSIQLRLASKRELSKGMSSPITEIPGHKVDPVYSGERHLTQLESGREVQDDKMNSSMQGEEGRQANESKTRPAEDWKISRDELLIIVSLSIINMVVALDSSIIVTALRVSIGIGRFSTRAGCESTDTEWQTITVDIRADTTQGFWIGTSYLLASTVVMPPVASVSAIFGRPLCLLLSLCAFTLGSLLCCVARSVTLLLAGRAVQGT